MENLVKRLQDEVGLTEEEAIKSLSIIKQFMDEEGLEIDWNKFFKGKYEEFTDSVKRIYEKATTQSQTYTEKIADKVEGLAAKARKGAHDLSQKAADFFDEK